MSAEVHVLGIRHHGPGSALALKRALLDFKPDCLLVEAPGEAELLFAQLLHPKLELPVALLIYNPTDFERAAYLPFAEFSPELQAVRYALQQEIPIRAMDVPMAIQFAQSFSQETTAHPGAEDAIPLQRDPMHYLAVLAGYADSERWWEATFEVGDHPGGIFDSVLELMTALRESPMRVESQETLVREAWMRQKIRQALQEGYGRVAVVCGAWHAPVLASYEAFSVKEDRALLRGLKKEKVSAAWIPWSYERLAFQSGYGSGVISPAWYELLFRNREAVAAHWMARAGRLFRQERLDSSPAHIQEAVRLAEALAALRLRSVPGIEELQEAAITVLCEGREARLQLIQERLVIGTQVGKVPPEYVVTPLQQDLERCVKAARLTREFQSAEMIRKTLDLRVPANLRASHLLHRLRLLDIPWGEPASIRGEQLGTFKESWKLKWKPDYTIRLIQAGLWGMQVEEAALNRTLDRVAKTETLPEALELLRRALEADLAAAGRAILDRIQVFAATTKEVDLLLATLPTLVQIIRYGNVRKTDREAVAALATEIIPRIFIGLPGAVRQVEEEYARQWFGLILQGHQALHILQGTGDQMGWYGALSEIALHPGSNPLLAGLATRLLLDERAWATSIIDQVLQGTLSNPSEALHSALWLEGFAHGSALLLLHTPGLWSRIDDWVEGVSDEHFKEIVPVLRRTFAQFSSAERGMIQKRVSQGTEEPDAPVVRLDPARVAVVTAAIDALLGK